uniref:Sugar ABC transporter permease n=1 Tax=uncultured Bacillota bacterium TaxID=344338 RepID=A0A650EPI5_9FIRM|nr:sugar ABC transporter permease [uncultured Firmicutes bacterium]
MVQQKGKGEIAFRVINSFVMLLIVAVTLYPLLYVLAVSLSSAEYVQARMVTIFPRGFNVDAYRQVMSDTYFWSSYKNTIVYTVTGTVLSLFLTTMLAYCLSRPNLFARKQLSFLILFTMFFSGGLVPNFLLVKQLHLYNTIWAIILPTGISTYNMIVTRTYMQGLPEELFESVKLDGGNDWQIFTRIVLPLSKPVVATIALFYAVGLWNGYFNPMIYLKDADKYPLQIILKDLILSQNASDLSGGASEALGQSMMTSEMIISASIIIAMIPILCVYPFIQKYFVKGVMLGAVKG